MLKAACQRRPARPSDCHNVCSHLGFPPAVLSSLTRWPPGAVGAAVRRRSCWRAQCGGYTESHSVWKDRSSALHTTHDFRPHLGSVQLQVLLCAVEQDLDGGDCAAEQVVPARRIQRRGQHVGNRWGTALAGHTEMPPQSNSMHMRRLRARHAHACHANRPGCLRTHMDMPRLNTSAWLL